MGYPKPIAAEYLGVVVIYGGLIVVWDRRRALLVALRLTAGLRATAEPLPTVVVLKSPACDCCVEWVAYLKDNGFTARTLDVPDMRGVKDTYGIPRELESCHTATAGDYVLEGHVPVSEISRLLAEAPDVMGTTVPGMPIGSPGMEMPGVPADPYDVLTFDRLGRTEAYARYH